MKPRKLLSIKAEEMSKLPFFWHRNPPLKHWHFAKCVPPVWEQDVWMSSRTKCLRSALIWDLGWAWSWTWDKARPFSSTAKESLKTRDPHSVRSCAAPWATMKHPLRRPSSEGPLMNKTERERWPLSESASEVSWPGQSLSRTSLDTDALFTGLERDEWPPELDRIH